MKIDVVFLTLGVTKNNYHSPLVCVSAAAVAVGLFLSELHISAHK